MPGQGLGGIVAASPADDAQYDYPRLERAVESLLEAHAKLQAENASLRADAQAREQRTADLEAALREQQERRADAIRRIDALVAQLDELDGRLERAEETRPADASAAR